MEIKTKFDLGQDVYVIVPYGVLATEIISIQISNSCVSDDQREQDGIYIEYESACVGLHDITTMFATLEEAKAAQ